MARVGGDQFAIILADIAAASDASAIAIEMVEALRAPFQHEGRALSTTVSIGLATFPNITTTRSS